VDGKEMQEEKTEFLFSISHFSFFEFEFVSAQRSFPAKAQRRKGKL